jgi:hypothetical protein
MRDLKKTLKIAGSISLVASLLGIASLLMNIFVYPFDPYYITSDAAEVVLSIITGVIYLVYMNKSENEIINHRGLFLALNILNIFNNLIVWAVSFWVDISVNNALKRQEFSNFTNGYQPFQNQQNSKQNESHQTINNEYVMNEDDYSVKKDGKSLKEKLEELNKLKEENMISEEEYNSLRKKIFEDLIK